MFVADGEGRDSQSIKAYGARRKILLVLIMLAMVSLIFRAVYLQVVDKPFLQKQARRQYVETVSVPAYRGKIQDRRGNSLAISTPVQSVWLNPFKVQAQDRDKLLQAARLLKLNKRKLEEILKNKAGRSFVYLKRRVNPDVAEKLKRMKISGMYFEEALKRFYPAGEITAHLLGFTNIDDVGQEGLERAYEASLKGIAGKKRVIKDGKGRVIKDVENIREPVAGHDLKLSIDERIQYLAYRELRSAFIRHKAHSAALIVLDAKTGEVLAAVNQPAFNPNRRRGLSARLFRNRVMVDVFEPGSTIKPLIMAAALDGGFVRPNEKIETHGFYKVGRQLVKDGHNYKTLSLTGILKKSSNVAISKIALRMPAEKMWGVFNHLGFGAQTGIGFPGEASGLLRDYQNWREFEQATMSFGYGLSVSVLQLARAYTALADDGILHSISLLPRETDEFAERVFTKKTARRVKYMLEAVVTQDGTAPQAQVPGYRVAGKTGTVKKLAAGGGYTKKRYISVFAGMAPVTDPRFVIVVMVDDPSAGQFYGGQVAAPVFSKVMAGALRVYGVTPDQESSMPVLLSK